MKYFVWVSNSENTEEGQDYKKDNLETPPPVFLQPSEEAWRASFKTTRLQPVLQQGGLRVPSGFNLPKTSNKPKTWQTGWGTTTTNSHCHPDCRQVGNREIPVCQPGTPPVISNGCEIHTVTLTRFIGKTLSKPPMICFMTDVFQREKKTENLWNNPWTSLKFVLWWLLEKMENTDNSTRFVPKFHFTVSWEHLPFFDLRVGRGSTCCSMHCHGSARAYSKQVLHEATSMLSVE